MVFSMKLFDLYGTTSQFTFVHNSEHKTNFSGTMSIFTVIAIIWSMIYFGNNFYQRTNPNFIYERKNEVVQTNFIANNSNLFLAIQIRDSLDKTLNITQYFDLEANYKKWTRLNVQDELILVKEKLNVVNCSDIEEYEGFTFYEAICYRFSNFTFGGYWDGNDVNILDFTLNYCLDQSYCKNISEIKNFLKNNKQNFNLYTRKTFVDLNDPNQIVKQNLKVTYFSIDPGLAKQKSLFYSRVNVSTDYGLLTEMKENETFLSLDIEINDYRSIDFSNNQLPPIQMRLYLNSESDNYTITFIKIQDVFASLGGIFSVIKLIFSNVAFFFNSYDKKIIMANKLFDFSNLETDQEMIKIENNEDKNNFNRSESIFAKDSIKVEGVENKVEIQSQSIDAISNELIKKLKEKKEKFHLNPSMFEIICRPKFKNEREKIIIELYAKADKIIREKLDIIHYLKFFEEYVLLKEILLDDFSNLCLTLRNRTKLYENNNFVKVHLPKIERLKKLMDVYATNRNTYSDSKILKILDEDILNRLQH